MQEELDVVTVCTSHRPGERRNGKYSRNFAWCFLTKPLASKVKDVQKLLLRNIFFFKKGKTFVVLKCYM